MKYGYACVNTDAQKTVLQFDALKKAECEKIFTDNGLSGATIQRSALTYLTFDRLLAYCRTTFCYIYRHKAVCRVRQLLADQRQSMSIQSKLIFELSDQVLCFTSKNKKAPIHN
jgi:hypothetical protein